MSGYVLETSPAVPASEVGKLQLDWTKLSAADLCAANDERPIRLPRDVASPEYDESFLPTSTELSLIGTSGYKVNEMGGLSALVNLETLILRSHLIEKIQDIENHTKISHLELYDNQITSLEGIPTTGDKMVILDISFNVIRSMEPVSNLPNLRELFIANNKITTIAGLENCTKLEVLDVGYNRIRKIEGLSSCVNLRDLWMGKNKITKIEGLSNLSKLKRLDIQNNRLTTIENLDSVCDTVEEIYLASNGINDAGLQGVNGVTDLAFPKLETIDLSKNRLTKLRDLSKLTTLKELWISENGVSDFEEVSTLAPLTSLETIYLEHNPLSRDFTYRKALKERLPTLIQIDANAILPGERMDTLASGGGPAMMTDQMRMDVAKRLQDKIVERAKEQKRVKEGSDDGGGGGGGKTSGGD